MIRGSIYWVNLEDTAPPEFGKTRPALILSNSQQNEVLSTVVVVPLSTRPPEMWPLRLGLDIPDKKRSFLVIPGVRQVSKTRLGKCLGVADPQAVEKAAEALEVYLSD